MVRLYDLYYYCGKCGRWLFKSLAKRDINGFPICLYCGAKVRTEPKHYKRLNND